MFRSPASRHARPTGRRAREAAYQDLLAELVSLRSERFADRTDVVRLTALTDSLSARLVTLTQELADARHELAAARAAVSAASAASAARPTPPTPDVALAALADQAADLRATVHEQQALLGELSARLLELLERASHEGADGAADPRPVAQPATTATPSSDASPAVSGQAVAPVLDLASSSGERPPVPAEALDDAALVRLRLIRASLGS